MKKIALLIVATAFLLAPGVGAEEPQTLNGEFHWTGGGSTGDLEAVFTAAGDGVWEVAFHFEFRGQPHTYSGTAEGSLTEGALEGTVKNESKKRTFTFSGTFADGKFKGTHAEIGSGRESSTGTLTLGGPS